jgi:hypothetical protein
MPRATAVAMTIETARRSTDTARAQARRTGVFETQFTKNPQLLPDIERCLKLFVMGFALRVIAGSSVRTFP